VAGVTLLMAVPCIALGLRIGSDFMPQLDEGAFLLQTVLPSEAALEEVDRLNHRVEDILRAVPEVEDVVRRTGRAERTEDPMPHTVSDVLVVLRPERSRSLEAIETDMREQLEGLPGIAVLFTTPLGMRIDEGLGGTPADLSVRIFGPDLEELSRLAEDAADLIRGITGVTDLRAEQLTGLPQLQIVVNRDATARVGRRLPLASERWTASPRSNSPSTIFTPAGKRLLPSESALQAPSSSTKEPFGFTCARIHFLRAVRG
jgi:cobalt-zinc-cadmium resistance protein CzcA